jgi:hypothetical protein
MSTFSPIRKLQEMVLNQSQPHLLYNLMQRVFEQFPLIVISDGRLDLHAAARRMAGLG